jgi:hypothetical protein
MWVIFAFTIFVASAGAMYVATMEDSDAYEPSVYYKMYAAHYEVTTYEYTYPRVHASSISRSSKEDWEPVRRLLRHRHSRDVSIDATADDDANRTPSYFAEAPKDFLAPNYYETETPLSSTYSAPTYYTETKKYDANSPGFPDGEIPLYFSTTVPF